MSAIGRVPLHDWILSVGAFLALSAVATASVRFLVRESILTTGVDGLVTDNVPYAVSLRRSSPSTGAEAARVSQIDGVEYCGWTTAVDPLGR